MQCAIQRVSFSEFLFLGEFWIGDVWVLDTHRICSKVCDRACMCVVSNDIFTVAIACMPFHPSSCIITAPLPPPTPPKTYTSTEKSTSSQILIEILRQCYACVYFSWYNNLAGTHTHIHMPTKDMVIDTAMIHLCWCWWCRLPFINSLLLAQMVWL